MTGTHKLVIGGLALIALTFGWTAVRASPGGAVKVPAANAEDLNFWYSPIPVPVVAVDDHTGPVIFTPHRYPKLAGGELTTLMHRGWGTAALPADDDMTWLSQPPSEVDL